MAKPLLFQQLETFRKQKGLSILALCRQMGVYNHTYHRWKKSGKITDAYQRVISNFLVSSKISSPASPSNSCDIAVIGIGCYYPGASNPQELWENILARRVQFRRMLDQRLPLGEYYDADPKAPEKTYLTKAAFLENFNFDWGRLRIPKKTVESTDIAHWLALDIALKTFEDAGYKLSEIPLQNTGVIVGNTLTGEQTRSQTLRLRWPYVQKVLNATLGHLGKSIEERSQIASEMEKIYKSAFYPVTEDSLAGGLANTIAGRICNYLNLKGGGYIVDGACSSSLLAVATAADALKMGNMDLALAGGVDISLDPFELVGFAKAGALARDQMRVYDQKANGFLPGEGCGFVLLKRLKDALRDKNYVYAVIKGWGISSDGKGGIMEPSSSGQSFAIGRAYKDLEYKISDVDFVEGHGTGTTKGDRVELEGIATAIDKTIKKGDEHKRECGVTSFKSIVGHTKAAAGVGGLLKAIMAVNQRILPPTANCTHPNDVFKDKAKNLYPIILGGRLPQDKIARAGISSAGFGGINCHVTLESKDGPKKELRSKLDERALFVSHQETEVFVFASPTITYLKKIIQKFKEDLRNISIAEMADLAALLNKKVKDRLPIKVAIVTDSPEHLYDALIMLEHEIDSFQVEEGAIHGIKAKDPATRIILSNRAVKSRVGFLYPGQGSQRLNMTRTLVHRYKWARDLFKLSDLPLFESVYLATDKFLTKEEQAAFEQRLSDTRITQPAIVLSSLIWTEFFSKLGIEPQISAGHSLGELTAFYKSGAFNKETLVKFAQLRGELMSAKGSSSGSMVSLFCSKDQAEALVEKVSGNIVIANINSPNQTVVSGGKKDIEKIKELAKKEGLHPYQLNVSNAFHSPFMKEAADKILKTKILPDNLREYFSKQVISPVDFIGTIESASKTCDLMIELGIGRVLTDLVKDINKDILCLPVESTAGNDRDLNIVLAEVFVRNVPVKFEELYRNRLIKTFVPASRKKFIENQCEHPLRIDKHVLTNKFAPVLLQAKEEVQPLEEIIPGGLPDVKGKDYISDLLINLTHKITGFDLESISLNLKLLDDLNLDSIKAAELIGQAARTLGVAGQIDPSQLSNKTLLEISDRLYVLSAQAKAGAVQETVSEILKRYHDRSWVRNFTSELRIEEIKTRNVNQLKELKNIAFLSGKNEEGLVQTLEKRFKNIKVKRSDHIHCLIAILPRYPVNFCHSERSEESQQFDKDSLKSIIDQLHQITDLATSNRLDKDSFVVFVEFGGGARAIASTLFLERPDLKVRVIDFDEKAEEDKMAQKIIDELQTYEPFNAVEYDAKMVRRVVYYKNSYPVDYKKRNISWSKNDLVLVTGGAKGITAQCALEFARTTKARMVLVGRSPHSPSSFPNASIGNPEIAQTLKQFEKENLKCSYYSCDVSKEKDVVAVISEIEKDLGKITGFVHGAGLNSLKRLKQTNVQEAFQEALPKVMGAVNICNALKDHPPKLIVGITSIIGLTGMEGSGWYGFSNEILNLYLQQYHTNVVTIAYSVWDEVGMGAKLGSVDRLAEKGIGAIPVEEGIRHFMQLVEGDPGTQQVIVAARVAGIGTWKSEELKTNNFRFLEKIEYILPGIELIARANLNIDDDPYLLDHDWKGSLLFPFVFGFEAMAQAVAYVSGVEKFDHIKAKDINLQRPIPVPQDSGTTIEIHAFVLDPRQVKVEIYSQETAYKEPHFSAVFEISSRHPERSEGSHPQIPKNIIDLDVSTDIYGPILFQGKMFQCIEQIHELYYDEAAKKGECVFTAVYNKSTEEFLKKNKKFNKRFLIGDPFFIDSMLQSMQVMIPQDLCLPREIGEIEVNPLREQTDSKWLVHSEIKRISADYYKCNAVLEAEGNFLKIKNCQLKVLDAILSNPSANDLVNSTKRDQEIIDKKFLKISNKFDITLPIINYSYHSGFRKMDKNSRHLAELPLIISTVQKASLRLNRNIKVKKSNIGWSVSGKPVVKGSHLNDLGLSLSHDNNSIICVSSLGKQGCDIETINIRGLIEWKDLLSKKYHELLNYLTQILGDKDLSGTIVWSALEIAKKIDFVQSDLILEHVDEDVVILKDRERKNGLILAIPFKLTNSKRRLISFYQEGFVLSKESNVEETKTKELFLKTSGFDAEAFSIQVDYSGPQKQFVFTKQFPITFRSNKLLSRRVLFTSYFEWMGELREYSVYPIRDRLTDMLESGVWGIATNWVKLDIFGDLRANDVVEGRVWMEEVSGRKESTFDLCFDWIRNASGKRSLRVAFSRQRVTWVRITGHGHAVVEEIPEAIKYYMDSMKPRSKLKETAHDSLQYSSDLNMGPMFKDFHKIYLMAKTFETSLENSNLVGNIYFANYGKWVGVITDHYFYQIIPDSYQGIAVDGEFFSTHCEIDHLSEAMPFDDVTVEMFVDKAYEKGLDLIFEFFLTKNNKKNRKLAVARQKLVWVRHDETSVKSFDLPLPIKKKFLTI